MVENHWQVKEWVLQLESSSNHNGAQEFLYNTILS
jgi:hypothetical protein